MIPSTVHYDPFLFRSLLLVLTSVFQLSPHDTVATDGGDTHLDCLPPDSNPSALISWTRNFAQLPSERFTVLSNGSLLITSVTLGDQALYHCVATNELLGVSATSDGARLTVLSESAVTYLSLTYAYELIMVMKCTVGPDSEES